MFFVCGVLLFFIGGLITGAGYDGSPRAIAGNLTAMVGVVLVFFSIGKFIWMHMP